MDFDALFNEKTFQFSDFQEFTVCFHGNGHLTPLKAQVNNTPEANAKLAPLRLWLTLCGCRQIRYVARKPAR